MAQNVEAKVAAALGAEEWEVARAAGPRVTGARLVEAGDQVMTGLTRHGLAAVALDGQPFGFTWDMLDALRDEYQFALGRNKQRMGDAIARIEALLPPRGKKDAEKAEWLEGPEV